VPVFYPQVAGVAEALDSGTKIDPNDLSATAAALAGILSDRNQWEEVAMRQTQEMKDYWDRDMRRSFNRSISGSRPRRWPARRWRRNDSGGPSRLRAPRNVLRSGEGGGGIRRAEPRGFR